MDRLPGGTTMRRSLSESLLLYSVIAALVITVLLTAILPAIANLSNMLMAGLARI
jgi:hypothetical protein